MTEKLDIKRIRQQLKLTQRELADKLDVDSVTVSRWESKNQRPHRSHIKRLLRLLSREKGGTNARDKEMDKV